MPPRLDHLDWDNSSIGYHSFDVVKEGIGDLFDCAENAVHHTWNYLPRLQQAASSHGFADPLTEGALGNNWLHRCMELWEGTSSTGGAKPEYSLYACGSVAWALIFAESLRVVLVEYLNGHRSCFFGANTNFSLGLSWAVADAAFEYPVPCRPMENKRDLQPHNISGFGIVDVLKPPNRDIFVTRRPQDHRLPARLSTPTPRETRLQTNWDGCFFQGRQRSGVPRCPTFGAIYRPHAFALENVAVYPPDHLAGTRLKGRFTGARRPRR
ncbi:MAG: hypothetical protein AAF355_07720 [Myxococcota bacterium]